MGLNAAARLKSDGVSVSKTDVLTVSIHDVYNPPAEGHVLSRVHHPRWGLTADDPGIAKLRDLIVADGEIIEPALVREDWIRDGVDGRTGAKVKVLTIVDGAGRIAAGKLAEPILGRSKDKPLRIKVRLFSGDDTALLLARQAADVQPGKRPHGPMHLAMMTKQYLASGGTIDEWMKVMPGYVRDYRMHQRDVEALVRWGDLHEDVAHALDTGLWHVNAGPSLPVSFGLFRALLDEPREEQPAMLARFLEEGVTHVKGATLVKNRDARAAARAQAETPRIIDKHTGATLEANALATRTGPSPKSDLPTTPAGATSSVPADRRPHPKAMRKVLAGLSEAGAALDGKNDAAQREAFHIALGIAFALGEDITDRLSPALRAALGGES